MLDGKDIFDEALNLEDVYYDKGFEEGVLDGKRLGLNQGRFAGLERGFERYAAIARLHGRAAIWAGKLPITSIAAIAVPRSSGDVATDRTYEERGGDRRPLSLGDTSFDNERVKKHVRILYALTEPVSLATSFSEDSEVELDDRFRRAEAKIRIVEKLSGEVAPGHAVSAAVHIHKRGTDDKFEDFSHI